MEVAFVSFLYPNVDHTGGSTYTFNLCKALSKRVDMTVFVPDVGDLRAINPEVSHISCKVLNASWFRSATFVFTAAEKLRRMKYQIVHSHCGAGMLLNKISVETFHHKPTLMESPPQVLCLRRAKHIIAVSLQAKQQLEGMGFSEDKITVVSNGIDYERFSPNPAARSLLNEKADVEDGTPLILSVPADGTKRKNVPWTLKMVKHLGEHGYSPVLLMVGNTKVKAKTLGQARVFGVLDRVRYVEDVSDKDMPLYYSACDFLAHPSVREGFGFVLLEAVASGRPFVAMNVGIAGELAAKGLGCVARSKEEFLESCLKMAERPLRIWDRGNEFVRQNYSWAQCAKETIKVYESIV